MFGRLFSGVNRRVLQNDVQRNLNKLGMKTDLEDISSVRDLREGAKLATQIWNALDELSIFVHEDGINEIVKDFLLDQSERLRQRDQETRKSFQD